MLERSSQILRIACLVLAGVLVYQFAQVALRWNPLARVTIPALPTLTETNDVAAVGSTSANRKTNSLNSTNALAKNLAGTNASNSMTVAAITNSVATNIASNMVAVVPIATNVLASNSVAIAVINTNVPSLTNALDKGTNAAPSLAALTNSNSPPGLTNISGTNLIAGKKSTNQTDPARIKEMAMAGLPSGGGVRSSGKKSAPLPPAVAARVVRITDSEIFAPVVHPMPAALMGIAGKSAFLRSTTGQTGMVKEGDSLGDLKLVRIGINRVLVEQDGDKKELIIFNGLGGESLLSKTNDVSHEITNQPSK